MASSSSSSSSIPDCKYDVFLNFRGEDTRRTFICHLYKALVQKLITTFIDDEELRKGNGLSQLLTAISYSRLSVVVISQNYASSTWCLKELVQILRWNPVFKSALPVYEPFNGYTDAIQSLQSENIESFTYCAVENSVLASCHLSGFWFCKVISLTASVWKSLRRPVVQEDSEFNPYLEYLIMRSRGLGVRD